jgi:hypothetical protein
MTVEKVTTLGSYKTLEELVAAHPTGNPGDFYRVGDKTYVWPSSALTWIDSNLQSWEVD